MPSRRSFLAVSSAIFVAGCTALGSSSPQSTLTCEPGSYTWPAYGANPARTSQVPARPLPDPDAEPRRFSETGQSAIGGGSVGAGPVVDENAAYVAGDVRIEARNVETGERLWAFEDHDGGVGTSPALGCGAVYVSTLRETVALDAEDGSLQWRADVGAVANQGGQGSPVVVDDTVFVSHGPTALDAETGEERWQAERPGTGNGFAVADRLYATDADRNRGWLTAIADGGEVWWRTEIGAAYSTPVVADDTVFVVTRGSAGGGVTDDDRTPSASATVAADPPRLSAVDAADGHIRWEAPVESGVYDLPAVAGGRVFVTAGNGRYSYAFDAETGERLWRFETGVSTSPPVVLGDRVLVTSANDGIYALDATTGERTWYSGDLGVVESQPVVADGRLFYVSALDSDVYVLE